MTFSWELVLVILLLILLLGYKQHVDRRQAYQEGATHGFMLGVDRTIGVMVDRQMVKRKSRSPVPTKEDLVAQLAPLIVESTIREGRRISGRD